MAPRSLWSRASLDSPSCAVAQMPTMVASTLLWSLLGVASGDISVTASCNYINDPEITVPAQVAQITKYEIGQLCPARENGGRLHNGACNKCAAKGDKARGKFVFCKGCNNSAGASCQEVLDFIFASEASTKVAPKSNESTSQAWTTTVATNGMTTQRATTLRRDGQVSANCAIPAESTVNRVKTPQIIKWVCDACFDPVPAMRTPPLETGCCDACLQFGQTGAKTKYSAQSVVPFVYCSGCDAAATAIFKPEKYALFTEAVAREEASKYLKAEACVGLPVGGSGGSGTSGSDGTIRKAVVMVSTHVLAACAVLEW